MNSNNLTVADKIMFTKMAKDEISRFTKLPRLKDDYKEIASSMMLNEIINQLENDDIYTNSFISSATEWDNYIDSMMYISTNFANAKKAVITELVNGNPDSGAKLMELNIKLLGSVRSLLIIRDLFNELGAHVEEFIQAGFIWSYDGHTYSFKLFS